MGGLFAEVLTEYEKISHSLEGYSLFLLILSW